MLGMQFKWWQATMLESKVARSNSSWPVGTIAIQTGFLDALKKIAALDISAELKAWHEALSGLDASPLLVEFVTKMWSIVKVCTKSIFTEKARIPATKPLWPSNKTPLPRQPILHPLFLSNHRDPQLLPFLLQVELLIWNWMQQVESARGEELWYRTKSHSHGDTLRQLCTIVRCIYLGACSQTRLLPVIFMR